MVDGYDTDDNVHVLAFQCRGFLGVIIRSWEYC